MSFGNVLTGLMLFCVSAVAYGATGGTDSGLIAIGAGIAIGLATFGAASAQGNTASSAMEGIARNPTAKDQLFMPFIISLALMEFHALLGFVIAFYWTFFK